jgi:hypothetical protein
MDKALKQKLSDDIAVMKVVIFQRDLEYHQKLEAIIHEKYTGNWVIGKRHGKGKLFFKDETWYEGDFADDEIEGSERQEAWIWKRNWRRRRNI